MKVALQRQSGWSHGRWLQMFQMARVVVDEAGSCKRGTDCNWRSWRRVDRNSVGDMVAGCSNHIHLPD